MSKGILVGIGVFIVLILLANYGLPDEINIFGAKWCIRNCNKPTSEDNPIPTQPMEPQIKDIIIEKLEPRQQVYKPKDIAYVDFEIENTLGVPYNLTVDWLFNDTRHKGWFNVSTDVYEVNRELNLWWSNYPAKKALGEWKVHLYIEYGFNNRSFSKDKITTFRVV